MTETRRPPRCHYDRALSQRVTTEHRDDCPTQQPAPATGDCPAAGRGCAPCTAPHCHICGREHATLEHPDTCPDCIGKIRGDLVELGRDYADLATEAIAGGHDGQLVGAAPIPGGTAQVLRGPAVRFDQVRVSRHTAKDHAIGRNGRTRDPVPPLAVLAQWEDIWRAWFGHPRAPRATVAGALRYLSEQLDVMANGQDGKGPDFLAFTRQIRTLRAGLERALHDEQEPERGVECFECGDQLVRRFRDPKRCRHKTAARVELHRALVRQQMGQDWLRIVGSYPEVEVNEQDLAAARGPSASLIAAARRPCAECVDRQGGLDDPRAGRSWECPGCRKVYDVGEYVTAVRRDLVDSEGHGWIHITAAAETVTDVVGVHITDSLVRKWLERGKVAGLCEWRPGARWGLRLVYWPDVVAAANDTVERMIAAAEERQARAAQESTWRRVVLAEVAAGRRIKPASRRVAKQLRIHPARAAVLLDELVEELAWRRAVEAGEDPVAAAKRLGVSRSRLSALLDTVAA